MSSFSAPRGRRFYWALKPYIISIQAILEMMAESMARRLRPAESIACVCDRNKQAAGEARQRFEFLRTSRTDWERLYPTLAFTSMRDELALQAADVLVYENCRSMQTWVRHQENGTHPSERAMRPLMRRLIKTGRMKGLFFDRNQIRALWAASLKSQQRTVDQQAASSLDEHQD